jgi:[acyl-carrier-protein] S-malonyltransferase
MRARLALLCAGQGGQHPAMFDLPRTDPHADASLNDSLSGARLGMPLQLSLQTTVPCFQTGWRNP